MALCSATKDAPEPREYKRWPVHLFFMVAPGWLHRDIKIDAEYRMKSVVRVHPQHAWEWFRDNHVPVLLIICFSSADEERRSCV